MISSTDKGDREGNRNNSLSLLASATLESSGDDGSFDNAGRITNNSDQEEEEETSVATSASDLQGTKLLLSEELAYYVNTNNMSSLLPLDRSISAASTSADSDLRGTTLLPSSSFSTSSNYGAASVTSSTGGKHVTNGSVTTNSTRRSSRRQILLQQTHVSAPVDLDEREDAMMRILAGHLTREWRSRAIGAPALERRIRDFRFAQGKRRDKYGKQKPIGVLGVYDHLAGIRLDLEWAEDAAWRRENNEPYLSWADFEITRKEGFNKPIFTYFLLLVCTVMLIVSIGLNNWKVESLSVNPMIGPSADTLVALGAKDSQLIVVESQWYRVFAPMVLHAGVIHYLLNMLALWFVGSAVEQCHGTLAATILFIIPAVGGTILSALLLPQFVSVGASGGIFGLVGACLADIVMNWNLLFSRHVNFTDKGRVIKHGWVLFWLFIDVLANCLMGLTPYVDNFTHLGGMIYGFLCGLSTMERLSQGFFGKSDDHFLHVRNLFIRFLGIFTCVAAIMTTTVLLLESDGLTSPCTLCRYVSCVPFPPWKGPTDKWWYCDDCASISGDAKKNVTSDIFDQLTLNCPNGEQTMVDITSSSVTNASSLSDSLPTYCRQFCPSTI